MQFFTFTGKEFLLEFYDSIFNGLFLFNLSGKDSLLIIFYDRASHFAVNNMNNTFYIWCHTFEKIVVDF